MVLIRELLEAAFRAEPTVYLEVLVPVGFMLVGSWLSWRLLEPYWD